MGWAGNAGGGGATGGATGGAIGAGAGAGAGACSGVETCSGAEEALGEGASVGVPALLSTAAESTLTPVHSRKLAHFEQKMSVSALIVPHFVQRINSIPH